MSEAAIAERMDAILTAHQGLEGPLLPILHAVQAEFGLIPAAAVAPIAKALALTGAEVEGVISFYHDFRRTPAGRHTIKLCRAEACQAMGGDQALARIEAALGLKLGESRADVTLEAVYCLGLCACGPAAQVDGQPIGRLDAAKVAAIAAEVLS